MSTVEVTSLETDDAAMRATIELDSVEVRYGDVVALRDISLSLERGRPLALLGRNGAGKTTLLSTIAGLLVPAEGSLRIPRHISVSYLPEDRGVYPAMTVNEHLRFFADLSGAGASAAERWSAAFDLGRYSDYRVRELSKGNQQRVQLACALIDTPDCILLDEPFSGLDPIGRELVKGILEDYAHDHWVVLSAHEVQTVTQMVTDIAFIRDGLIVEIGSLEDIYSMHGGNRLTVDHPSALDAVVAATPGLTSTRTQSGRLQITGLADHRAALALIEQGGDPGSFDWAPPSMSDLFISILGPEEDRS